MNLFAPRTQQPVVLYPYQTDLVDQLPVLWREGHRRILVYAPTGAGKTEIACKIGENTVANGKRMAFLVDRINLVDQAYDRFMKYGLDVGRIHRDDDTGRYTGIVVISMQTLEKWTMEEIVAFFDLFELVSYDECHAYRQKIREALSKSKTREVGFTATPHTAGLAKIYTAVVKGVTTNQLIEKGYLTKMLVYQAEPDRMVNTDGVRTVGGEYVRSDLSKRVMQIIGDIPTEWIKRTQEVFGGPVKTIAFTPDVAEGAELCERFQKLGYDFRQIHYKTKPNERRALIKAFERGEIIGLVSVDALAKGFDVPDIKCLICARSYRKAFHAHIQQIGRVMRAAEGKDFALAIFHVENWVVFLEQTHDLFEHGPGPLDDNDRKEPKKQDREDKPPPVCPKCQMVWQTWEPTCPGCGYVRQKPRTVEHISGKTREIDEVGGVQYKLEMRAGEIWNDVCAYVTHHIPGDPARAERTARANYIEICKQRKVDPGRRRTFRFVNAQPTPEISEQIEKNRKAYFVRKRAMERKRAEGR